MDSICFHETPASLASAPVAVLSTDQPARSSFPPHVHASGQLIYAISGVMLVRSDAGSWVVPTGRAVWVPGGVRHEIEIASDVQMRTVYVAPGARADMPTACKVIRVSPLLRELIVTAASIEPAHRDGARERRIFELLLDEIGLAAPLLLHVPMPRHTALARLCRELIAQPCGDVTLDTWAGRADMHPRTFARAFRRETGMTHGAWCRHTRLLLSLQRLAAGASILDIAIEHGYDSPSAFSAMFRKALGVAPSDYFR
ncbi:helix-turn-helix transcriptional regulator [Paraburkholderia sp.]|uniref:AraC family transcriptional regulator n=1 Tax=Paraburkholderia sp. TaxID=1926495 RepID=UPI002384DB18|nr:helix-turn-helix transcriptional regulator [Paraburkholderia sp.]MDE1179388.1 helix-turn-helix transcriptional regulator [Paraburkholderia sp.]